MGKGIHTGLYRDYSRCTVVVAAALIALFFVCSPSRQVVVFELEEHVNAPGYSIIHVDTLQENDGTTVKRVLMVKD